MYDEPPKLSLRLAQNFPYTPALLPLLALLAVCVPLRAQPALPPTLNTILQQLQTNLDQYDANIPSLFCDEHVVSQMTPGPRDENTVTDSVFRLKRVVNQDHTSTLDESRQVLTVNGKPATSQDIAGPTLVSGAFEGGLAIVSANQQACMNYTLRAPRRGDPGGPYIIRFSSVLTPQNSADCLLQENGKGFASIDPATMQIMHMELTTPHHIIIRASPYDSAVTGKWILAIDYAPVLLDQKTFWMPANISSHATSGADTFHKIVWSFHATYRNFHKLEVKSRVLPSGDPPTP